LVAGGAENPASEEAGYSSSVRKRASAEAGAIPRITSTATGSLGIRANQYHK